MANDRQRSVPGFRILFIGVGTWRYEQQSPLNPITRLTDHRTTRFFTSLTHCSPSLTKALAAQSKCYGRWNARWQSAARAPRLRRLRDRKSVENSLLRVIPAPRRTTSSAAIANTRTEWW